MTEKPKITEINLDGPCPPPPGKPNPQPIPPGGHSLLPGGAISEKLVPLQITDPDPLVKEQLAREEAEKQALEQSPERVEMNDALNKLSPDDVQILLELIGRRRAHKKDEFEIPDLEITEEDKDKISDCLAFGKLFQEEYVRAKGKLKIVFRNKLADEQDVIFAQLRQDSADKIFQNEWEWSTQLNKYNLLVQLHSLNGVDQPRAIPTPASRPRDFSLRQVLQNSLIGSMPAERIYIFLAILGQFEKKLRTISNLIIKDEDF